LIQDVMHLYTPGPNIVPVQSELDPHCPAILGDAQQLRQIIHNLVQNAQDATEAARSKLAPNTAPAPYPAVTVRTQWSSTSERVRLLIEDRGTGFPEQILQRAFEPYVTTKVKGTGLGLAVVKKIADEHRAKITLSNLESESTVIGARISISFIVAPTQQAIEYKASA
jgi:nitrogen fixation/metabolism regulation signal transduction histidine kinase